jgi:hypothetical protein
MRITRHSVGTILADSTAESPGCREILRPDQFVHVWLRRPFALNELVKRATEGFKVGAA